MNQSSHDDPDLPLIRAIGSGDTHALSEIYERHGAGILSFLINRLHDRQHAEEILQDVMLAVWKAAATFRGECLVRTWLMTIARNHSIDAYNGRKPPNLPLNEAIISDNTSVPAVVEQAFLSERLGCIFQQLSVDQREAVRLVLVQSLTYAEAAEVLGVPEGTVKSRLHHARQTMRRLLQMEGITHA
jgi:RNA polymerase sigma-70 factor (ECF subfamily)